MGFCTRQQVTENVTAALQGLGLAPNPAADEEAAVVARIREVLAPVAGVTWPSGLPENN